MSSDTFDQLCQAADKRLKAHRGHTPLMILKLKCTRCGASRKQMEKYDCRYWFSRFMELLKEEIVSDSSLRNKTEIPNEIGLKL